MVGEGGEEVQDPAEIKVAMINFYKDLYTESVFECKIFNWQNIKMKCLSLLVFLV